MKRFFDPCRRQRQGICLLASGALSEPERVETERHLAACADCRKYYAEMKAVTASLGDSMKAYSDVQPRPAAQARWTRAIHAASQATPSREIASAAVICQWWREVIWPWRRVWCGLATVWVIILAGNISSHPSSRMVAMKSSRPTQEMVTAFKDQQKILAELLADHSAPRDAERPKLFSPKPRTERAEVISV
jgi:anti-sigma factor RsiW